MHGLKLMLHVLMMHQLLLSLTLRRQRAVERVIDGSLLHSVHRWCLMCGCSRPLWKPSLRHLALWWCHSFCRTIGFHVLIPAINLLRFDNCWRRGGSRWSSCRLQDFGSEWESSTLHGGFPLILVICYFGQLRIDRCVRCVSRRLTHL